MQRPEWLARESARWEADGVITPEQRRTILERYPDSPLKSDQFSARALVWLAWLVAGFALILLVTWNWMSIPAAVKLAGTSGVTLALYGAAWHAYRSAMPGRAEWLAFGAALSAGAIQGTVMEVWSFGPTETLPLLFWALVVAVTAVVVASPITTTLGAGLLIFWALTDTGRPPAPWAFMFVFPFLAVALERRSHPYAAGAVTLALGVWVPLIGLDSWRASLIPGAMLLAASGALDKWAHMPDGRRPAFARSTPALALMVIGLTFLGAAALHHSALPSVGGDWSTILPALTLLGALTLFAIWPSEAQRAARWRPMVFGALVVVWMLSITIASRQPATPAWWMWMWTVLTSVALVVLTVSAVREGSATRNRGLFVVGVCAMIALVAMHFTGEETSVGRSALVLFVVAAVLWWASRAASRPGSAAPTV
jgi:hypothetical protein